MTNVPPIPNITRLRKWAETRDLVIAASPGTQRDPENVVALKHGGSSGVTLVSQHSLDSVDTAAAYVINTLELLGIEVPR